MKKYTILKNWHYPLFLFGRLFSFHYNKKQFIINFKFSDECYWSTSRNSDDYDLNKLFGISFNLFTVHKNSVRLAWRPNFDNPNVIDIYGYTYDSVGTGQHKSLFLDSVNTDVQYSAIIKIEDQKYTFSLNGNQIEMDNLVPDKKCQFNSYPYFGGNNRAIQTMYIYAKLIAS